MQNLFTRCFLEVYPPDGIKIYADEYNEPHIDSTNYNYATDPRVMFLFFLGLPARRRTYNVKYLSNKQLLLDVFLNFIGYQNKGAWWWRWFNILLIIPTTIYHATSIPFHLLFNVLKFFTEYLPHVLAMALRQLVIDIESIPCKGTAIEINLQQGLLIAIAATPRLLSYAFSAIRFISRALTDPSGGMTAGWRIGNAIGGAKVITDISDCDKHELRTNIKGQVIGGLLASLSGFITISVFIITLPLFLTYHGIYLPDIIVEAIPQWVLRLMDIILNPLIDVLIDCLGLERFCKIFHIPYGWDDVMVREELTLGLGILHIVKSMAEDLLSPHAREEAKDFLTETIEVIQHYFTHPAELPNAFAACLSTHGKLLQNNHMSAASGSAPTVVATKEISNESGWLPRFFQYNERPLQCEELYFANGNILPPRRAAAAA